MMKKLGIKRFNEGGKDFSWCKKSDQMKICLKRIHLKHFWVLLLSVLLLFTVLLTALGQERPKITEICNVHITYGKDASKKAIISWRSSVQNADDARVVFWPDGREAEKREAVADHHSYRYAREYVYLYDSRLTDLEADTLYHYQILCGGKESPVYNFYSGIEPGSDKSFTFAVLGDSRGSYDISAQLLRDAYEADARFAVFTGDITDGAAQYEWDFWFAAAADTMPYLPVMPVHGNHEAMSNTYFDQFVLPDDERNYSFDFGMTHWSIFLDNTKDLIQAARPWLEEDLANSDAIWKIVVSHKPFYSSVKDPDPVEATPTPYLLEVIEKGGVTMTFAGHKHNYERTHPLLNGQVVENGKGIVHHVTGGAGAPLYDFAEEQFFTAKREKVYHMIICDITPHMMKATVKAVNGAIIDEYVVYPRQ